MNKFFDSSRVRQIVYLICCVIGFIGTQICNWYYYAYHDFQFFYFVGWFDAANWFYDGFMNSADAIGPDGKHIYVSFNPASSFVSIEAYVFCMACSALMFFESRRLRMKNFIWYIIGGVLLAFAFTVPLFLYHRERKLQETEQEKGK